jgi:hypothetical protein
MGSHHLAPARPIPARATGSVRRTSHLDIVLAADGGLLLAGAARDLRTVAGGAGITVASAGLQARVGPDRRLLELASTPGEPRLTALLGRPVGSGFRRAVAASVPEHAGAGTPLHLLLDDLPVAALIGGFAIRYARGRAGLADPDPPRPVDVCAGWRAGGSALRALRLHGSMPVMTGPEAPAPDDAGDPLAWHGMEPLPVRAMRRRRCIEVLPGDPLRVQAMFRDTHVDDAGIERVLHEYAVLITVDARSHRVLAVQATPGALPFAECPEACATAASIEGHELPLLRNYVEQALYGPSTCTHLNDLLRSLADGVALAEMAAQS